MTIQKTPLKRKKLASSIVTFLTLILLFKFGNTLISYRVLSEDNAWLAYNIIQLVESVILPTVALCLSKPNYHKLRAVLLALIIYNTASFFQYCILMFNPEYFFLTVIVFICLVIPFLYRYIVENFHPVSDVYNTHDCFLVYKRPRSMSGSLCALITAPYGHCSLVVRNKEFIYKRGVLIEREFFYKNNLTFKKIDNINLSEIRKLLGTKWSLRNNCFSTFNKFHKRDS